MSYDNPTEKEYKQIWGSHINDLTRLGLFLGEEDWKTLQKSQKQIEGLVDKAWQKKMSMARVKKLTGMK